MGKPIRHDHPKVPILEAKVLATESKAKVSIQLFNRTAHRETFWVTGVAQEVGITLDGNMNYGVDLVIAAGSAIVEVRRDNPTGTLLGSLRLRNPDVLELTG